jgi:hypothetical protein
MTIRIIFLWGCFSLLFAAEGFAADPPVGIVVSGGDLKTKNPRWIQRLQCHDLRHGAVTGITSPVIRISTLPRAKILEVYLRILFQHPHNQNGPPLSATC